MEVELAGYMGLLLSTIVELRKVSRFVIPADDND